MKGTMMKVHGYTVTEEQQAAIIAAMKGYFEMKDIVGAAIRAGVGEGYSVGGYDCQWTIANRTVDRLLQQERKAGRIRFVDGRWRKATMIQEIVGER